MVPRLLFAKHMARPVPKRSLEHSRVVLNIAALVEWRGSHRRAISIKEAVAWERQVAFSGAVV